MTNRTAGAQDRLPIAFRADNLCALQGLGLACASRESNKVRPLRYSINITLDGCCHHEAGLAPDEESMRYWTAEMERAGAVLFGRVTYEMMESAWRLPATGTWPDWMGEWEIPFAEAIHRAKKYVVSSTLSGVDWNAELIGGDLGQAVQQLKQEPGEGLFVGGVTLPLALADLGLIDEYEFLVQPVLAGHGPTLLAGLRERIELELVNRHEFRSGAVALRYRSKRATA
jgi:dihydrofolate reductase